MNKIELICIIDDDPIFVFGAKKILETNNICNNFLVYKNGKEAIDNLVKLKQQGEKVPDVIILDINMPILDGWGFLEHYSTDVNESEKAPVFMASSSIDSRDVEKAKNNSMIKGYILKPVNYTSFDIIEDVCFV